MVILKESNPLVESDDEITSLDRKDAINLILDIVKLYKQAVVHIYSPAGGSSQTGKYDKVKVSGNILICKNSRVPENQMNLLFNDILSAEKQTITKTGILYVRLLLKTKFYVTISGKIPLTVAPVW